ncbi:MAG TPA: glycosyltransferase, partial [Ktedonobacteraceae bacterium]|nr:glycosyltransferase [Ktedonobacteraceae bacterium]
RQQLLQESIRRACCIIATSEQVRAELIARWSTEKERICVIAPETDTRAQAKTMLVVYQAALDRPRALSRVLESKLPVTEQNLPGVSVIIPASRLKKANQTLAALKAQSYRGRFETIVVGPPARALASCWPIIAVPTGPVCEPGKARNLGATQAKGEILLFLDDDVIVAEDWVEKNVCVLQQPNVGVVGARIVGKSHAFFARCIDFTNYGHYQHRHPFDGPVASSSMGIARTIFHEVGGFNETLCSGEDIDLCYRVQKQGYRSVYRPDILVIHDHQRTTFSKLLRYNYGHGLAGGLKTKIQHRDSTLKNRLLCSLRFPLLFLPFLPAIALLATLHIVVLNIGDNKRVLLYAPFIFLGKLAYELGVFVSILLDAFGVI